MLWLKTLIGITVQAFFLGAIIYLPAWTWYWEDAITWFSIFYFMTFFTSRLCLYPPPNSMQLTFGFLQTASSQPVAIVALLVMPLRMHRTRKNQVKTK